MRIFFFGFIIDALKMLYPVILLPLFSLTVEVKLFIKHVPLSYACGERKYEHHVDPDSSGRGCETGQALKYLVGKCGQGKTEISKLPQQRNTAHDEFLCHHTHNARAEGYC